MREKKTQIIITLNNMSCKKIGQYLNLRPLEYESRKDERHNDTSVRQLKAKASCDDKLITKISRCSSEFYSFFFQVIERNLTYDKIFAKNDKTKKH